MSPTTETVAVIKQDHDEQTNESRAPVNLGREALAHSGMSNHREFRMW